MKQLITIALFFFTVFGTAQTAPDLMYNALKVSLDDVSIITTPLEDVEFTNASSDIILGNSYQSTLSFTPVNATDKTGNYVSSNTGVATVNSSGLITSVSEGSSTITFTANDGSFTADITINVVDEPLPAFPSAYGAGAYTTGGRGGTILHVTNLNDSGTGSLRWALLEEYPRTIVFDVSGVIEVNSDIDTDSGDFTVAGQTAPEGGITIIGTSGIKVTADNWIVRYIRFRNGYDDTNVDGGWVNTTSSISARGSNNFIFDHCSGALSKETAGFGGGKTDDGITEPVFTTQRNLIAESDRGTIVGSSDSDQVCTATVYQNVYINAGWRFPKGGGRIKLDVINTYVYNWEGRTIRMDPYDYELNIIGNSYEAGNLTRLTNGSHPMFQTWTNSTMNPQIWDEDTFVTPYSYNGGSSTYDPRPTGYPTDKSAGWGLFASSTEPIKSSWFVNSRLTLNGRTPLILSGDEVKDFVLNEAGANKYIDNNAEFQTYRDTIDINAIQLATLAAEGTGKYAESEYEDLANALVGTTPTETRPNNFYDSNSHIPEAFFVANGITGTPTIHNENAPSGYTWLEKYLNQVDN